MPDYTQISLQNMQNRFDKLVDVCYHTSNNMKTLKRLICEPGVWFLIGSQFIGIVLFVAGCYSLASLKEKKAFVDPLIGWNIDDLMRSGEWVVEGESFSVRAEVPFSGWEAKQYGFRNIALRKKGAGKPIMLICTHKDDEDGGNTFGWVESEGKRVAWIVDGEIVKQGRKM